MVFSPALLRRVLSALFLLLPFPSSLGAFETLWSLGAVDGNPDEFGDSVWGTASPGSPAALDDDFYFAGSYPPPVGTLASSEPASRFEDSLTSGSPLARFHFTLSTTQARPSARARFVAYLIWGWQDGSKAFGSHTIEVRLNGVLLGSQTLTHAGTLVVEAPATMAVSGPNVLEVRRAGAALPYSSISFDALSLELDPLAMTDADADGLPRFWELDHGLDDSLAADAALDPDGDSLSHLQEFALGTNPRLADTDGDGLPDSQESSSSPLLADSDADGLSDSFELSKVPPLNPNHSDSDGDATPDAWELATGFSPSDPASTPPPLAHAVGINFVSELHPANTIPASAVAGFYPQPHWNHTRPLTSWNDPTGSRADITSPLPGSLVNSAGLPSSLTFSWQSASAWGNGNRSTLSARLLDGFLQAASPSEPVILSLSSIPYASYELVVHVGSSYEGARGFLRLNDNPSTDHAFTASSTAPEARFIQTFRPDASPPWKANTIRYSGLSSPSASLALHPVGDHQVGIHAVQIIDLAADSDSDGLPDAWEIRHGLKPALAGDALLDPDSDGLTHLQEFLRGTDPSLADSDADGLPDGVESATGSYISASDTGSHPLLADSDSDGLADGAEVHAKPFPTNPNLADSDSDGRSDAQELADGTHPSLSDSPAAHLPVITTSPARSFDWLLDNVQLLWDHSRGSPSDGPWGDALLFSIDLRNSASPSTEALRVGLRARHHAVTHFFFSGAFGAFSAPSSPGSDLWESDWDTPPSDLTTALGFSGVGSSDFSSRLRFRVHGSSSGSQSAWSLAFTITNLDTGLTVVSRSFTSCRAADSLHSATAVWQNTGDPPQQGRFSLQLHPGLQLFFSPDRLEDLPAFAARKDSDNDGMPDSWEDLHAFDKNSPADAPLDADLDSLSNLRECLLDTHPRLADTDGDGVPDGVEDAERSDPLLASSRPPFWPGPPPGLSSADFNANSLPDAWELWSGRFDLQPSADDDGDGQSNADEAIAGTHPLDPQSRAWTRADSLPPDLRIAWPRLENKTSILQQSPSLLPGSWTPAPGSPVPADTEFRQTVPAFDSPDRLFFRVAISDIDSDSDGVSDWDEINVLGSDPLSSSSLRAALPIDANADGSPDATLSGDYAAYLQSLQGSSASGGFPGAPPSPPPGSGISHVQAARFLSQATFGPTLEDIDRLRLLGCPAWITEQINTPPTLHSTYARAISDDLFSHRADLTYSHSEMDHFLFGNNLMTAFARGAIQGPDQLRQRVAFALSQILVTSRRDANLENRVLGMASYYDIFVRHAFGNYLDILRDVTFHPVMGRYLSHVGNAKARPEISQFPDENYARELMQLFTIGLWQLHPDGSRQLAAGQPVPTYSNTEITQLARVFTGFWFGAHNWGQGGWTEADFATPLSLHADHHDFGAKTLVGGRVLPARAPTPENARRDVEDALHHLLHHPNTAPFISRQLIQFLVTDNPAPGYVQRVAAVFTDNGRGVTGDLGAVIPAILLDEEARRHRPSTRSPEFGRLKEPVIRAMALGRAFGLKNAANLLWWDWSDFYDASRQEPARSPSVFNFYRPDYRAPGILTQNQLAGPVFQITDSFSSIAFPNHLWRLVNEGFHQWGRYQFPLDIAREIALASQPEKLIDHLNLLLAAGHLQPSTRSIILGAVTQIPASRPADRARLAIYLTLTSPEAAIMR